MKKTLILSLFLLLFAGTATAENSCKPSDKKCLARIAEGEMAAEKVMRGAIEQIMMTLEDPIMKKMIGAQLADCNGNDDSSDTDEVAEEKSAKDSEMETIPRTKMECYQEILSNHFIIDMLPEAFSDAIQKYFTSGGKM